MKFEFSRELRPSDAAVLFSYVADVRLLADLLNDVADLPE